MDTASQPADPHQPLTTLGGPWDSFDAYLFDIDGTLLNCADAVHYFAFCHALESIAGKPMNLDGVTAHGNTDVGILRDAFLRAGIDDARWRPHLDEIKQTMCNFVSRDAENVCAQVMPRVRELLEHLRGRGALLGVATGNLQGIGEIKLRRAGLLEFFDFAAWSDDFEYRADVFRAAVGKARELAGPSARLCAVGDTPADIAAARDNSLPVIAVATGVYPIEQLQATGANLCIRSFADLVPAP